MTGEEQTVKDLPVGRLLILERISNTNLRAHQQYNISLGIDLPFEEDEAGSGRAAFNAEVSAYDGGHTGDGGKANAVAGLFYAERTGAAAQSGALTSTFSATTTKTSAMRWS